MEENISKHPEDSEEPPKYFKVIGKCLRLKGGGLKCHLRQVEQPQTDEDEGLPGTIPKMESTTENIKDGEFSDFMDEEEEEYCKTDEKVESAADKIKESEPPDFGGNEEDGGKEVEISR